MSIKITTRAVLVALVLGSFTLGYVCGSVTQPRADAQGVSGVLEQAGKAGGPLASASQLGSSIVEMEKHVSGLQKNLDTLKKVQSALTGK
jgi:hypothetical protein